MIFVAPWLPLWRLAVAWTKLHRRWLLAGLMFEQAIHHIVLEDNIAAVEAAEARRDRLTAQIETMLPDWTLALPSVQCAADDAAVHARWNSMRRDAVDCRNWAISSPLFADPCAG